MARRKTNDLSIPGHIWQQPSGRWTGRRYIGTTGERMQRTFDTHEEVITWLRDLDKRQRLGRYIAPAEMTVSDLVERWLEQTEVFQSARPVTLHRHRRNYELHIQPTLGPLRVQEIDRARMRQWVMQLAANYSPSLIRNCLAILNGAFRDAVDMKIIDDNPCSNVKRPPERRKPIQTWTIEECSKLLAVVKDDPMWFAVYRVLLGTGMRQGELRALRWSDVNFTKGRIHIRRTMTMTQDGKVIVGTDTKTGGERVVALAAGPAAALRSWQDTKPIRPINPERDYVFGTRPGSPLGLSYWQKRHDAFIAEAGIRRIPLHGTRHSFATVSMEQGIHPKIVQEALGHSRIETTLNRYSHVSVDLQQAAAEALDNVLMQGENRAKTSK
jgi:integrase